MESESDIRGIYRLLEDALKDLPHRNCKNITPAVVPVDVHQPDEAAAPVICNRKCGRKPTPVALLASDLPPVLPVHRRLDEP
jgi:hypothetical protein